MNWKERVLSLIPETSWEPVIKKWQQDNPYTSEWFTLWIWPENENPEQTAFLEKILNDKGIAYTKKYDYGIDYPASIDSVVYCLGDINIENAEAEFSKITVDDSMVYYEGVPVALIGAYMDKEMNL